MRKTNWTLLLLIGLLTAAAAPVARAADTCDPLLDGDFDGDGYTAIGACEGSADDFDDFEVTAYPGHPELGCDGVNNDGDPETLDDQQCARVDSQVLLRVDEARLLAKDLDDDDLGWQVIDLLDAVADLFLGLDDVGALDALSRASTLVADSGGAKEGPKGSATALQDALDAALFEMENFGVASTVASFAPWKTRVGACNGRLDTFYFGPADQYTVGDFDGDGRDEVLATSHLSGHEQVLEFDPTTDTWNRRSGSSNGMIDLWYLGADDRYAAGDFDHDGRDELLAINHVSGYEHVIDYDTSLNAWDWRSGSGNGMIDLWYTGPKDLFVVGNFDGDSEDELLAVNYLSAYEHVIEYDQAAFDWQWRSGSGNGAIDLWNTGSKDRYVAGDFDGDSEDELLAVNFLSAYEQVIEYDELVSEWDWRSGSGNGRIDLWNTGPGDRYLAGDFDGDASDELLAISSVSAYEHVIDYDRNTSQWRWKSGSGNGMIDLWPTDLGDRYLVGDFDGDGDDEVLAISYSSGCWQVIEYQTCAEPPNDMVGWWSFDEAAGSVAGDLAGTHDGIVLGASWLDPSLDDFTIVALPDTQNYAEILADDSTADDIFKIQTQWIVAERQNLNLQYVTHLGDITQRGNHPVEWQNADAALSILDGLVPYALAPGNHDGHRSYPVFNAHFPPSRYLAKPWYIDHLPFAPQYTTDGNQNSYHFFEVGGLRYGILALEFDPAGTTSSQPVLPALAWAGTVVASHPDRQWIVITHDYLKHSGPRTPSGDAIFQQFVSQHPNVSIVLCGHAPGEEHSTSNRPDGPPVEEVLSDYQNISNGTRASGLGYLRIYRFEPRHDRVTAITYSPYCDGFDASSSPPACDPWDVSSYANMDGQVFSFVHPMTGRVKGALRFDGEDDRVVVPDDPSLDIGTSDFTVDAWVRPRQHAGVQPIVDKRSVGTAGVRGYHVFLTGGRLGVQLADGTHQNFVVPLGMEVPLDNRWHFVSVSVRRGVGIEFRVNGQTHSVTATGHTGSLANTEPLLLGGHSTGPGGGFWGDLDEIEIFDRALADSELEAIYLAGGLGKCK